MPFWSKYTDPPTSMICGFKKEHMLSRDLLGSGQTNAKRVATYPYCQQAQL